MATEPEITRRVEITKVIRLDDEQLAAILKKHFDMPNAEVNFDCGYEILKEVTLTEKTVTNE